MESVLSFFLFIWIIIGRYTHRHTDTHSTIVHLSNYVV